METAEDLLAGEDEGFFSFGCTDPLSPLGPLDLGRSDPRAAPGPTRAPTKFLDGARRLAPAPDRDPRRAPGLRPIPALSALGGRDP